VTGYNLVIYHINSNPGYVDFKMASINYKCVLKKTKYVLQ